MMQVQLPQDLNQYVDVDDALKRVCGNKVIYKKLLGTFRNGLEYDHLCEAAQSQNYQEAAQLAHSMKGVAANLSLKALYEKLLQVEQELKNAAINEDDLQDLGNVLQATLQCTEYIQNTL